MTRATITRGAFVTVVLLLGILLLVVAAGYQLLRQNVHPAATSSPAIPTATPPTENEAHPTAATHQGFLYGRILTADGATFEGRLRWGGNEEAFWGDYFNGAKPENPWLAQVPPEQRPKERRPIVIFGVELVQRERPSKVDRPFMRRFGELARIEATGTEVRVTSKSGAVVALDRFEASDFDDGVRVWDGKRGVVDLDSLRIRTIELLPTPPLDDAPYRLHGTVKTRQGDFTGFVGWNRERYVGSDELTGHTAEGELSLRFDTLRSITRHTQDGSPDSSLVTLRDGREIVLGDSAEVGPENRGTYVADRRYGRVLVSWDAFERLDLSHPGQGEGGSGPAYDDFPPGSPLAGRVTTRDGRRLAGRLVFDLDESETTETLDASSQGVNYTIPFALIAAVVPPGHEEHAPKHARVTLHSGEELELEPSGDLGPTNAGLLIFVDGAESPEYVPWSDVERVELDLPPADLLPVPLR